MDRQIPLLLFIFSLFAFLSPVPAEAVAAPEHIILSEIQVDGKDSTGKAAGEDEFIELYNPTSKSIVLAGLKLCRKTSGTTTSQIKSFSTSDSIAGKSYFLFANSDGIFGSLADAKTKSSPLAKNNSIALADDCASPTLILDSIAWGSGKKFGDATALTENPAAGHSLLRDLTSLLWSETATPSPRASSATSGDSPLPPNPPEPIPYPAPETSTSIRINEIFPNPEAKGDSGEFIELYNFGSKAINISNWTLRDATKSGKYTFPSGTSLAASGYLVVTDQSFKLSLNNTNETVSLFDEGEVLIDTVSYIKTKEDVSLNYTGSGWRGGMPTPGHANILNTLPEIREKVPKKGFKNTTISFRAEGDDTDNDLLKYAWDFGDGHKSYKNKTTHRYEKNGTYTVTLTISDGKEDSIETFTLKIESYKAPKIRITALSPNPAGEDTDNEWMLIENREKKAVNLKDFSIATGWKNLVNHPIREDVFVPPKQEIKLTRTDSLFTLPNQKGRIELRAPDGAVLQKIKYKSEQAITEAAVYKKEKGKKWAWQMAQTTDNDQQITQKSDLPIVTLTDQENDAPEEMTPPENPDVPTEESSEQEVLGTTTPRTDDIEKKLWQFLSSGTRVRIPDSIQPTLDAAPKEPSPAPPEEHYAVSFARTSLSEINATLNQWMDALQ